MGVEIKPDHLFLWHGLLLCLGSLDDYVAGEWGEKNKELQVSSSLVHSDELNSFSASH